MVSKLNALASGHYLPPVIPSLQVIDRLLLYVFFAVTATGTMGILCSAPNVFEYVDQATVLNNLRAAAAASRQTAS